MLKHHSAPLPPAEQRQVLAADERKREFHEEKRNEFESFAEEEHDGTEARDISDTFGENHPLAHCSSNSTSSPQNKTSGAERAPSSGGSFTTTACILPRSTAVTPPETEEDHDGVNRRGISDTLY